MVVPYDGCPPWPEDVEEPDFICRGCHWGRETTQDRLRDIDRYLSVYGRYHQDLRWIRPD